MSFERNLYTLLASGNFDNLFFSPFSVRTALTLAAAGAREHTAREMAAVLEFGRSDATNLVPFLKEQGIKMGADGTLRVANRVWAQKGFPFNQGYLNLLGRELIELVDFASQSESVRAGINDWVALQTEQKIRNLLTPGSLDAQVKMVLVNALYFYANWVSKFDPEYIRQGDFFLDDRRSVKAPLMWQEGRFKYASLDGYSVLEMPYVGGQKSMLVLLPDQKVVDLSLSVLPDPANLKRSLRPEKVSITFPKFKIDWGFDLAQALSRMGMSSAFGYQADFSGMEPSKSLYISGVFHRACVAVDEVGTEAAAATAVVTRSKGSAVERVYPFCADHPFVFWILHGDKVLFMGRVMDPTAG